MQSLSRRRVLCGVASTLALAGCTERQDDTERLDFFATRVGRNDEFDVYLDFLEGDEVTVEVTALDEGRVTVDLTHGERSLLSESVAGPGSSTFELAIQRRDGTLHELALTTGETDAAVDVTVVR